MGVMGSKYLIQLDLPLSCRFCVSFATYGTPHALLQAVTFFGTDSKI